MKTKELFPRLAFLAVGLVVGYFVLPSGAPSAEQAQPEAEADAEPTTWTCSMHPQVQRPKPGDCPICGMDLIPMDAQDDSDEGPRTLSMSDASRALAEIQTTEVVREFPSTEIRLVGELGFDETRVKSLTARFPARIDELFVNYTGITVNQGEHLARVYSPELLSAQRELLTSHRADPDSSTTRAARDKLRLWDLLPEQIDAIIESGEAQDNFVLKAPISGVVVAKHVNEGDYLSTGEPLFEIVDLTRLWAKLDAYQSDLAWLRFGQEVNFTVESFPGESFGGPIIFIEPTVDARSRTVSVRVNVPNTDQRLKPGMFVSAVVKARLADDGQVYAPEFSGKWISPMHPEVVKDQPGQCDVCGMDLVPAEDLGYVDASEKPAPLTVPTTAVLRTGERAVVYVEKPEAERPTYEGREIRLGARAGDVFIVASGLEADERVVTNGAFKIDSALQIQARPSMMRPDESTTADETTTPSVLIAADQIQQILPPYLELQGALAEDDLKVSKKSLQKLMEVTGHEGQLAKVIHEMMAAEDLDGIRKPRFETLSNALIAAVEEHPDSLGRDQSPLYQMHCPMVYDDRGADWLQAEDTLLNPYFGTSMLRCGEVKNELPDDQ